MIKTSISVTDQGVQLTIGVRIWRDQQHNTGIVALDPKDEASRSLMIQERGFIKTALGQAHSLTDLVCYESQGNGLYTPGHSTMLRNGASLKESELVRVANDIEANGWKRCQDLSNNRLPPAPEL